MRAIPTFTLLFFILPFLISCTKVISPIVLESGAEINTSIDKKTPTGVPFLDYALFTENFSKITDYFIARYEGVYSSTDSHNSFYNNPNKICSDIHILLGKTPDMCYYERNSIGETAISESISLLRRFTKNYPNIIEGTTHICIYSRSGVDGYVIFTRHEYVKGSSTHLTGYNPYYFSFASVYPTNQ
jgi:hypothetical protein